MRLRRSQPDGPGIRRQVRGRGFSYLDADGVPLRDPEVVQRIRDLVIPPAWRDVWICPWPNGHIQATGVDARGRTQYRYHDEWRRQQDRDKFDHVLDFARALPGLRIAVEKDLASDPPLGRDQVLAGATRLLDLGFFRVGSDAYAEENGTYGLATMLKRHVSVHGEEVVFDFPAKGGKRRVQAVVDPDVRDLVASLRRRRGDGALLAWREPGRRPRWVDVHSDDINAYIRERSGVACSAKDFRTWNATVLAAVALALAQPGISPARRKRWVVQAMREVAHYLGNTPAVVRSSYVDPRVVTRFEDGRTIARHLAHIGEDVPPGQVAVHGAVEAAVIDLLASG